MASRFVPDRYEAAIRWEKISQIIRDNDRYGYKTTTAQQKEAKEARADYELATKVLRG